MKGRRSENKEKFAHIQKAILDIEKFIIDADEEEFLQNDLLNNAILMQFIIIGEAIGHVDTDILEQYDYPWYKVRAFRNFIAHQYFNVKLSAVWAVIQTDLKPLKKIIDTIIQTGF